MVPSAHLKKYAVYIYKARTRMDVDRGGFYDSAFRIGGSLDAAKLFGSKSASSDMRLRSRTVVASLASGLGACIDIYMRCSPRAVPGADCIVTTIGERGGRVIANYPTPPPPQ